MKKTGPSVHKLILTNIGSFHSFSDLYTYGEMIIQITGKNVLLNGTKVVSGGRLVIFPDW
jgi:hypothetical protein